MISESVTDGAEHGAGQPAAILVALEEAPERLTRDAEPLSRALLPVLVCADVEVDPDRVDQLVVAHSWNPRGAGRWVSDGRANGCRGAVSASMPIDGADPESTGSLL